MYLCQVESYKMLGRPFNNSKNFVLVRTEFLVFLLKKGAGSDMELIKKFRELFFISYLKNILCTDFGNMVKYILIEYMF